MNKKGFLPLAVMIILAIGAFLIVGFVLGGILFSAKFKLAAAGITLIILSLIFGFKSNWKKNTGKVMVTFIIIGVFLVLISSFNIVQTQMTIKPHYFYSGELGLIKISSPSIFVKQSYFSDTQLVVGQSTKINTVATKILSSYISTATLKINKDGSTIQTIDVTSKMKVNSDQIFSISFTPTQIGKYQASVVLKLTDGSTQTLNPDNTLVVSTANQACNKKPYYGSWSKIKDISNGFIQTRIFYKVSDSCSYINVWDEDMIVCNNNYIVSGTSSTQAQWNGNAGGQLCESASPEEQEERIPECDTDLITECGDGTEVVTKKCSDGYLIDSGNKCSVIDISENNENNNINNSEENNNLPDDNDDNSDNTSDDKIKDNLPLIAKIIAGVVLALILVIAIKFFMNRRK